VADKVRAIFARVSQEGFMGPTVRTRECEVAGIAVLFTCTGLR